MEKSAYLYYIMNLTLFRSLINKMAIAWLSYRLNSMMKLYPPLFVEICPETKQGFQADTQPLMTEMGDMQDANTCYGISVLYDVPGTFLVLIPPPWLGDLQNLTQIYCYSTSKIWNRVISIPLALAWSNFAKNAWKTWFCFQIKWNKLYFRNKKLADGASIGKRVPIHFP